MTGRRSEREREILEKALSLVANRGFAAVTMDEISAASRSSKATLYRRWRDKTELVADALDEAEPDKLATPDTGSLEGDIHAAVTAGFDHYKGNAGLFIALLHAATTQPLIQAALSRRLTSNLAGLHDLLDRAIDRGELVASRIDEELIDIAFLAPLLLVPAFRGTETSLIEFRRYIDQVLIPVIMSHRAPAT